MPRFPHLQREVCGSALLPGLLGVAWVRQCHQLVSYAAPACLPKGGRTFGTLSRAGPCGACERPALKSPPQGLAAKPWAEGWMPSRFPGRPGLSAALDAPTAPPLLSPSCSRGRQRPWLATSDCAACSLPLFLLPFPCVLPLIFTRCPQACLLLFSFLSLPAIASSRKLSWAAPLPLELHPGCLCSGPAWAPVEGFTEVRVGFLPPE